ncbi:hypothetical protein [Haliangium sp.]|uniref:hypothetical protein n=1 Tax=Haliangium sp. TaxID=2663208 RepID=UPI003D142B76
MTPTTPTLSLRALTSSALILLLGATLSSACISEFGGDGDSAGDEAPAPPTALASVADDLLEPGTQAIEFKTFALQPLEPVSVAAVGWSTFVGGSTTSERDAGEDMEVRRYTYTGSPQWTRQWGGPGDDRLLAMDASATGFAITGNTAGPVYFGLPVDDSALDGTVVVSFDSDGNQTWGVALTPVIPSATFTPVDLARAPDGSVAVLGTFTGPMDFGGIIGSGCFGIAYYGPDGAVEWVYSASATSCILLAPGGIEFDDDGNLWYAGTHRFSMSLGGCQVGGSPYHQPHVFEFAPDGTCQWAQQWPIQGDILHSSLRDLAISDDSVVITGKLPNPPAFIDFGGGALFGPGQYLVRLDSTGGHEFSARYDPPMRVAAASDGRVFTAARFEGTVDMGGGPVTSAGAGDILVTEHSATGAYLDGASLLRGPADQDVFDADVDGASRLRIIGKSADTPDSFFLAVQRPKRWSE